MKVLVVDDDRVLADLVGFAFRREGFEVIQAHDGETALARWQEESPDLVVLDVNLPQMDGFSVCRQIRSQADTPIIMLTVRSEEEDLIHGLEIGADDYVAKPFSPRQLIARAQAVLRRTNTGAVQPAVRQIADLQLDPTRRTATVGHRIVTLTPLESRLLDFLLLNPGQILPTKTIIDHVWGPQGGNQAMLRQLVHRLRNKIEANSDEPAYIETVPGIGYGLKASLVRE